MLDLRVVAAQKRRARLAHELNEALVARRQLFAAALAGVRRRRCHGLRRLLAHLAHRTAAAPFLAHFGLRRGLIGAGLERARSYSAARNVAVHASAVAAGSVDARLWEECRVRTTALDRTICTLPRALRVAIDPIRCCACRRHRWVRVVHRHKRDGVYDSQRTGVGFAAVSSLACGGGHVTTVLGERQHHILRADGLCLEVVSLNVVSLNVAPLNVAPLNVAPLKVAERARREGHVAVLAWRARPRVLVYGVVLLGERASRERLRVVVVVLHPVVAETIAQVRIRTLALVARPARFVRGRRGNDIQIQRGIPFLQPVGEHAAGVARFNEHHHAAVLALGVHALERLFEVSLVEVLRENQNVREAQDATAAVVCKVHKNVVVFR